MSNEDPEKSTIEQINAPNSDGTLHQGKLGPKAKRKHFFSPLDPKYAEAVHMDAENVIFTEEEEVRVPYVCA